MTAATQSTAPAETLSVLVLTRNEAGNVSKLLAGISEALGGAGHEFEVVIVDASTDGTADLARRAGARVIRQSGRTYGDALREGIAACRGDYVLTLDADMSHDPRVLLGLLGLRRDADIVVASRYVPDGKADMPASRRALSLALNGAFRVLLRLPVRDASSGFRVYRRKALAGLSPRGDHFDVLPEIIARAHAQGVRVAEVPFHYRPREAGSSKARVLKFGPSYARTLLRLLSTNLTKRH